jgi:aminomethyltransferase
MAEFAGYDMPLCYSSVVAEHNAVRRSTGVFDVSHMARFEVFGEKGCQSLMRAFSVDSKEMGVGSARYGFAIAEDGGVIDDLIVYRIGEGEWFVVANASNREPVRDLLENAGDGFEDVTDTTSMLAIQGPKSRDVLSKGLESIPNRSMQIVASKFLGADVTLATTGYTGEDGAELIGAVEVIVALWEWVTGPANVTPVGLGARDTLRLEMGYPLYGHELDPAKTPWQVGLAFGVDASNREFLGRDKLMERKTETGHQLVGLKANGRGIPRAGQRVVSGDDPVGEITSGTHSPSLGCGIALAFVDALYAELGSEVTVLPDEGRKTRPVLTTVVKPPFYRSGSRKPSAP